jgi:hypothetical protein
MPVTTAAARTAHISFDGKGDKRAVRVSYPGQLSVDDIGRIDRLLISDVIKGLTGCSCLSGVIDVIWEKQYEKVIDVQLALGK